MTGYSLLDTPGFAFGYPLASVTESLAFAQLGTRSLKLQAMQKKAE